MTGETKAILGIGLAIVGVGGGIYIATRKTAAASSGGSTSPGGASSTTTTTTTGRPWVRTTVVNPGDFVRVSVLIADISMYAAAMQSLIAQGSTDPAVLGLENAYQALVKQWAPNQPSAQAGTVLFMTQGPYGQALSPGTGIATFVPAAGDQLPADWPTDDPNPAQEAHAQFTYAGAQALQVASLPVPTFVWKQQ